MSRSFWRKRPNSSPPEAFCRRAVGRRRLDKERGTPVESCSLPIQPPARTAHKEKTDMTRPITLILAALTLAVAVPAAAQEGTLKKIKDSGSITIGHRDASIPFSYYDDRQQPVGYAVDLCLRIVDAVKSELKMPNLKRSEEHTSELQSRLHLVCRLLLEKKKTTHTLHYHTLITR